VVLEAGVKIHTGVVIGAGTRVRSGAVVGGRGFGFRPAGSQWTPIPHLGGVVVGTDCEIGPNSCIAAGFLEPTRLGDRVRLDALVQVAHNVEVGDDVYLCAHVDLAGSCRIGNRVWLGGGAQVDNGVRVGDDCRISASAGVTRDVPDGSAMAGFPALPLAEWRRSVVAARRSVEAGNARVAGSAGGIGVARGSGTQNDKQSDGNEEAK
jgi:UDP-3-O-[3-hydroxymyristoyl] glucosamine N-acyltransferase